MSKEVQWVKAESTSHPGRCYYYNRVTKASTWVRPPELAEDVEIPSLPAGKRGQKKRRDVADVETGNKPLQNAWSQPAAAGESKPADSREKEDTLHVVAERKRIERKEKTVSKPAMAVKGGEEIEEAMEVERWGEEEEIAMDIDVSQEDIAEMKLVRSNFSSPSQLHIESFGIPSDYTNDYSDKLYLVLDTNVLLSHLNFLEELKDYAIKGVGKPVLVIPWIVLQELDKHKSRGTDRLAGKARKAVRLLFSCFTSKHPRVRCQTMEETQTEVHNVAIENNDDRILHCCLLYRTKTKGHSGIVVLFSNDVNLCTKAVGNGVKAADRTTLLKELRSMCQAPPKATPPMTTKAPPTKPHLTLKIPPLTSPTHGHTPNAIYMASPPVTPFTPKTPYSAGIMPNPPGLKQSREVNDAVSEAESILRETLSIPLKQEMVNAFDDFWSAVIIAKPPWSLKDELFLIEKHWIAVYGQVLSSHVRGVNTQLYHSIRNRPGVLTVDEALIFVRRATSLIQGFTSCTYCSDSISSATSRLNQLADKLRHMKPPVALVSPMGPSSIPLLSPAVPSSSSSIPLLSPAVPSSSSSSLPLLTTPPSSLTTSLSLKEKLTLAAQAPPTEPSNQLEWVLGLIHNSIIYSQTMVQETLGSTQSSSDRANVGSFIRQIGELLAQIVSSLQSLFESGVTIPRMQDVLVAFNCFLNQALLVSSPLTINVFFELVSAKEQRELLETALKTFSTMLSQLQGIDASF